MADARHLAANERLNGELGGGGWERNTNRSPSKAPNELTGLEYSHVSIGISTKVKQYRDMLTRKRSCRHKNWERICNDTDEFSS